MNIECGSLIRVNKDELEFRGSAQLGDRLNGVLILRKHAFAGSSPNHPDYTVEYTPHGGAPRRAGAAWLKNGARVGDFLSMTLDDPDWPTAINLSAFPPAANSQSPNWPLVWSRPRSVRVQNHPPAEMGS